MCAWNWVPFFPGPFDASAIVAPARLTTITAASAYRSRLVSIRLSFPLEYGASPRRYDTRRGAVSRVSDPAARPFPFKREGRSFDALCRNRSAPRRRELDRRALPRDRGHRRGDAPLLVEPAHAEGMGFRSARNAPLAVAAGGDQPAHSLTRGSCHRRRGERPPLDVAEPLAGGPRRAGASLGAARRPRAA